MVTNTNDILGLFYPFWPSLLPSFPTMTFNLCLPPPKKTLSHIENVLLKGPCVFLHWHSRSFMYSLERSLLMKFVLIL